MEEGGRRDEDFCHLRQKKNAFSSETLGLTSFLLVFTTRANALFLPKKETTVCTRDTQSRRLYKKAIARPSDTDLAAFFTGVWPRWLGGRLVVVAYTLLFYNSTPPSRIAFAFCLFYSFRPRPRYRKKWCMYTIEDNSKRKKK